MAYGSHLGNYEKVSYVKKRTRQVLTDDTPDRYCKNCEEPTKVLKLKLCESCYSRPHVRSQYSITPKEQKIRIDWDAKLRRELIEEDKRLSSPPELTDLFGWR